MMNRGVINETIVRPDSKLIEELASFDVATLHEAHKTMGGWSLLPPLFQCLPDEEASCVGTAITALLPEHDNLAMHKLTDIAQPGDVMVMQSVQSSGLTGMCGDLVALSAKSKGVSGIIANGSIRDVRGIRATGLPIWYRTVNALGMPQRRIAGLNVPIAMNGVIVRPGAIVAADRDGILVIEPADAGELLERAARRADFERDVLPRLEAGESMYAIRDLESAYQVGVNEVLQRGYPD